MPKDCKCARSLSLRNNSRNPCDTDIEKLFKAGLRTAGVKFFQNYSVRKNGRHLANVDFYIPKNNLCIFCDGCYWHCCPTHGRGMKKEAVERDHRVNRKLQEHGYTVLRFFGCDIKTRLDLCISSVLDELPLENSRSETIT